jgi:catechol 2,3-dioxygenase-like lactoylglutathione lyase family enzyme
MNVTSAAVSLNVADERASAEFLTSYFGFTTEMEADGFVSLSRPDVGFNVIFLRLGLKTFKPPALAGRRADGLLLVFVVDDIDGEAARLSSLGLGFTTPPETEPWGERFFQVTDPNGVVIQLVQWLQTEPEGERAAPS